jgi:dimethylaniline monooxygenase (N-oxide forming)
MYDFAIIGFGISGISFVKALNEQSKKYKYIIIEKSEQFGGCWNTALSNTELQTDKKYYEYNDCPMPDNYPIYPNKSQILSYLNLVITKYKLNTNVYYNHELQNSDFDNIYQNWELIIKNKNKNKLITIKTKYLIICNGYYNIKNTININNFTNKVIHIKDINEHNLNIFNNKNITIIGNGASCCDFLNSIKEKTYNKLYVIYKEDKYYIKKLIFNISISIILTEYSLSIFKKIPLQIYRLLFKLINFIFCNNYLNIPNSKINSSNLIGNTIIPSLINKKKLIYIKDTIIGYKNNNILLETTTLFNIDYIILCNGYSENYDFLNSIYKYNNRYKQVINPYIENCAFIGLSPSYNWLQTSYNQSKWYLNTIINKKKILNKSNMISSINKLEEEKKKYNLKYNDLTYDLFSKI